MRITKPDGRQWNRWRAVLAALALCVSTVLATAVTATPAQARCFGEDTEITSTLIVNGKVVMSERPIPGTCNGNNEYRFEFKSHQEHWQAVVYIQNNGEWTAYRGGFDQEWHERRYFDNNSRSHMTLCLNAGSAYVCGFGTSVTVTNGGPDHTYWGENVGF